MTTSNQRVHVNPYERTRFGRREHVREHYRSHPAL